MYLDHRLVYSPFLPELPSFALLSLIPSWHSGHFQFPDPLIASPSGGFDVFVIQ